MLSRHMGEKIKLETCKSSPVTERYLSREFILTDFKGLRWHLFSLIVYSESKKVISVEKKVAGQEYLNIFL